MIFSDQETADKIRKEAEEAIKEWTRKIFTDGQEYPDAEGSSIDQYIEGQVHNDMPDIVKVLLYRSGIIHAERSYDKGMNPITLFYDRDENYDVTKSIGTTPGSLDGGLVNGRIHT